VDLGSGGKLISILLPTRCRAESLKESLSSLLVNASDPYGIEILLAVDPDDAGCYTLDDYPELQVWIAPERFGYARLHEYFNFLARQAEGEWLMLWNDDARMMTPGWDEIIHAHSLDHRPVEVLWPLVNHAAGGNLFPVWPAWWADELGYVSLASNIDVWVSETARRLGVEVRVPIKVFHDRADVTGGHSDQTFAEGRALMGQGNHPAYDNQANRAERSRAVRVLRSKMTESLSR
jgi:hypothetical protein